jgi:hypothetical protein
MRLTAAARLPVRWVRRAMTFSAIARPLLIAAFTLSRERADRRLDLRFFFAAMVDLPSWKDIEQCLERIELRAEDPF